MRKAENNKYKGREYLLKICIISLTVFKETTLPALVVLYYFSNKYFRISFPTESRNNNKEKTVSFNFYGITYLEKGRVTFQLSVSRLNI